MPQNTFSGTGITDGSTIEASQVSQSVDAFTGAADYRITTTGSLTLSGSLNMSGSFVNEFTGQFSALGLGVTAPTAPTMLHIKDTSIAADPIVLLEGATGTDSARIRFSNADVMYDVGAYGSSGDSFMIIQDQTGTPKFQFIIGKDEPSYALQIQNGVVGSGMGASFSANPSSLADGSIQAAATVSGSLLSGVTISASAAGPSANIHGTASWASNVITANTASYVKLEDVDNNYSASGIFNSAYNISSTQTSSAHDFRFGKVNAALVDFQNAILVSGSSGGNSFFGSVDENCYVKVGGSGNFIKLNSGGDVYIDGNAVASDDLRVSGSATPSLIVGPNTGAPGSNNPSASLFHDSLEFFKANKVYIGNYNNSSNAITQIVGGGNENAGIQVSSSGDIRFDQNGTSGTNKTIFFIDITGRNYGNSMTPANFSTGSYMQIGQTQNDGSGPVEMYFPLSQSQVNSGGNDVILWQWDNGTNSRLNGSTFNVEVSIGCVATSNAAVGAYKKISSTFGLNSGNLSQVGNNTTLVNHVHPNLADIVVTVSGSSNDVFVKASDASSVNVMWSGFVKVTSFGNSTGF